MVLIIAEKPSLARNIVAGIGDSDKLTKQDGYFIGKNYQSGQEWPACFHKGKQAGIVLVPDETIAFVS